jgi:hypothetical protein
MNSFIFNFRAVIAAILTIAVIESTIFAVHPSSFVERSNYLDWNYGTYENFYKAMIYHKLDVFAHSAPDIIQVGDSSGLHGVNPEVVTKYLGGLKYVNLSSVANAGLGGHYAIADFMFRRNPSIKALVLYVTLNQFSNVDIIRGDLGLIGAERIRSSFTDVWAYLNPPSMALRRDMTDAVYSEWGTLRPREKHIFEVGTGNVFADMLDSTREHYGWWPEHDPRFAGKKLHDYWHRFCGDDGTRFVDDAEGNYIHAPLLGRQSYVRVYLQRFADLAARHGAKFIVIFQAYPCEKMEGTWLPARRADLETVRERNKNVVFEPESIFEPWPIEAFSAYDHVRVGYVEKNFERVGHLLADALGMSGAHRDGAEPSTTPSSTSAGSTPDSVLGQAGSIGLNWRPDGISLSPVTGSDQPSSTSLQIIEGDGSGPHLVEKQLRDTRPGSYVISAIAKPIRDRGLRLEIGDGASPTSPENVQCNMNGLEAVRGVGALDGGLDLLPDGWLRCWFSVTLPGAGGLLKVALLNERGQVIYTGDGASGVLLTDVTLQPEGRP